MFRCIDDAHVADDGEDEARKLDVRCSLLSFQVHRWIRTHL